MLRYGTASVPVVKEYQNQLVLKSKTITMNTSTDIVRPLLIRLGKNMCIAKLNSLFTIVQFISKCLM
ncbi:hypothetical protein HanRHA438_Chr05g0212701 [Helianthus annuus]|nr:hypothetical protein HanRHA438_Chr05g0212701 [Helianthus annuus]